MFRSIRDALVFAVAASEETPEETDVSPTALKEDDPMYSVGFDPLDGSSIIDANFSGINVIFLLLRCSPSPPAQVFVSICSRVTLFFASPFVASLFTNFCFLVGSIFGIWPGKGLLGRTGREQVASVVSLYGPRTTLIIALPHKSRDADHTGDIVFEVTLLEGHTRWEVSRHEVVLEPSKKVFGKSWGGGGGGIGGAFYYLIYSPTLQNRCSIVSSWKPARDELQSRL